jgi:chorismate mutase
MRVGQDVKKGMGMTEQEDRLARERAEIAARVASFKATQERFERERNEYFVTTLENARNGSERPSSWS